MVRDLHGWLLATLIAAIAAACGGPSATGDDAGAPTDAAADATTAADGRSGDDADGDARAELPPAPDAPDAHVADVSRDDGAAGADAARDALPRDADVSAPDVGDAARADSADTPGEAGPSDAAGDRDTPGDTATGPADVAPDALPPLPPPYCVADRCSAGPTATPDPTTFGPFTVGVRTETLETVDHAGQPRHLKVDIWYPGRPGTGATEPFVYDLVADAPAAMQEQFAGYTVATLPVAAYRDMAVFAEYGPYPLVIFSHGAYGIRYQSLFFTVPLASHGYVVVAPDHEGNTLYDLFLEGYSEQALAASALDRIGDGRFLLDTFIARASDPADPFHGAIDRYRVGFSGHSFGGFLSLYMGGKDPRVRVALPFSPATSMLAALQVPAERYPVPFMMQGGLLDRTLGYEGEMLRYFERGARPKFLVELARGGHFTYSDICRLDLASIAVDLGYDEATNALSDGCGPDNIPYEDAHVIIRQTAIAFLNAYLREDRAAAQFYGPEAAAPYGAELRIVAEP